MSSGTPPVGCRQGSTETVTLGSSTSIACERCRASLVPLVEQPARQAVPVRQTRVRVGNQTRGARLGTRDLLASVRRHPRCGDGSRQQASSILGSPAIGQPLATEPRERAALVFGNNGEAATVAQMLMEPDSARGRLSRSKPGAEFSNGASWRLPVIVPRTR